jgi:hypothetical protein
MLLTGKSIPVPTHMSMVGKQVERMERKPA